MSHIDLIDELSVPNDVGDTSVDVAGDDLVEIEVGWRIEMDGSENEVVVVTVLEWVAPSVV